MPKTLLPSVLDTCKRIKNTPSNVKRHKSAIPRRHDLKQITPSNENMSSSDAEKDRERIWCIESAEAVARYVCDWLIPLTPGISGLLSLASQYKT